MSTSGLGRGLGSLLEPKNAASAKRPSSRGFGVLIGDAVSKTPGGPAPGEANTDNLVYPSSVVSESGDVGNGGNVLSDFEQKSNSGIGVRWICRTLLVADLLLVVVAAWLLIEPTLRAQRGIPVIGGLLMAVATVLGVLSFRLSR